MEFGSSDELTKFKEIVTIIRTSLNDNEGNSICSILLKQLENGQDITSVMGLLFAWKVPPEIAIGDFQAAFNAIEHMLMHLEKRELNYLQVSTITVGTDIHLDVKVVYPGVGVEVAVQKGSQDTVIEHTTEHANDNDISAATEAVVREDIKEVASDTFRVLEKGHAEMKAISDTSVDTSVERNVSDWKTPNCVSRMSSAGKTDSRKSDTRKEANTNHFGSLFNNDDDDDDDKDFDEFAGSAGMEQSMDDQSDDSNILDVTLKVKKKSEARRFFERKDLCLRDKGWIHVNRVVQSGDVNILSIEDVCYFVNRTPKAMKQAKTETLTSFDVGIEKRLVAAESKLNRTCNDVVDKALNALNKEDGMVFNKIRINRTQLENEVAVSVKQCAKQNQANNTSHAVVADLENFLDGHGKMQKNSGITCKETRGSGN